MNIFFADKEDKDILNNDVRFMSSMDWKTGLQMKLTSLSSVNYIINELPSDYYQKIKTHNIWYHVQIPVTLESQDTLVEFKIKKDKKWEKDITVAEPNHELIVNNRKFVFVFWEEKELIQITLPEIITGGYWVNRSVVYVPEFVGNSFRIMIGTNEIYNNNSTSCKISTFVEYLPYIRNTKYYICKINNKLQNKLQNDIVYIETKGKKYKVCIDGLLDDLYYEDICNEPLGVIQESDNRIKFRFWNPLAKHVALDLHEIRDIELTVTDKKYVHPMKKLSNGIWECEMAESKNLQFYRFIVYEKNNKNIVLDPYGYVLNSEKDYHLVTLVGKNQEKTPIKKTTMRIPTVYETHILDKTIFDSNVPEADRGKFRGIMYSKNIEQLAYNGVTHIQFMPVNDIATMTSKISPYVPDLVETLNPEYARKQMLIDGNRNSYNWGYDVGYLGTLNNSYATSIHNVHNEFRDMVKHLHSLNLGVIIDIVVNHLYNNVFSYCDNYFYRKNGFGNITNSGFGNDLALENKIVQKYVLDMLRRYKDEYGIDGFRIDLMNMMNIELATKIKELDVILYGEAWDFGSLKDRIEQYTFQNDSLIAIPYQKAPLVYKNIQFADIALYFNDKYRDSILGSIFDDYLGGLYNKSGKWADFCHKTDGTMEYITCHDNYTLFDMIALKLSATDGHNIGKLLNIYRTVISMLILSFRPILLQDGVEILKSKNGDHNSYNTGVYFNAFNTWTKSFPVNVKNPNGLKKAFSMIDTPSNYDIDQMQQLTFKLLNLRTKVINCNPKFDFIEVVNESCVIISYNCEYDKKVLLVINLTSDEKEYEYPYVNLSNFHNEIGTASINYNKVKLTPGVSCFLNF